jgi:hypothetical protein
MISLEESFVMQSKEDFLKPFWVHQAILMAFLTGR